MPGDETHACRVCGLCYEDQQWGVDGASPTYEFCDCCGVEFGYDDSTVLEFLEHRYLLTEPVVIAALDGELVCKVLDMRCRRLLSANETYPPIAISDAVELVVEGTVTYAIRHLSPHVRAG